MLTVDKSNARAPQMDHWISQLFHTPTFIRPKVHILFNILSSIAIILPQFLMLSKRQ